MEDDPSSGPRWSTAGPLSVPFETHPCPCRSEHAPSVPWTHAHHVWPKYAGGPDVEANIVYVCPATHDWTHVIWRLFEVYGGVIGRRREWPLHAYDVARLGWRWMTAGKVGA